MAYIGGWDRTPFDAMWLLDSTDIELTLGGRELVNPTTERENK